MITVGHAAAEQQRIRDALAAGVTEPQWIGWHYDAPAVVLGRGQRPSPALLQRASDERLPVIGRASGGGAVLAGPWMLSLTLLLPVGHALHRASLPGSYRAVGDACRRALERFQLRTALARVAAAGASTHGTDELHWACFAASSHGELVADGERKVVGVAQLRRRDAMAVCIGVLLGRPDWAALLRVYLGRDDLELVRQFEGRTASCAQLASNGELPTVEALACAVTAELPLHPSPN